MKTLMKCALGLSLACLTLSAEARPRATKLAKARAQTQSVGHDQLVAACVQSREAAFACQEPFIDAMMKLRSAAGQLKLDESEWAAAREEGLRELAEDGSGPRAPREAKCAQVVDAGRMKLGQTDVDEMVSCYAVADCDGRVACMMKVFERTLR